ncbi:Nucleotide-binding oligomerization domain-containing protein 2 [Holothuria leucospilota]|uniref:Nucleotide-binding oligomerization domain-containing protein 2 n=1 Tax=Holothuria leucospilota TaxID=206669 RepID=A0A9Q0YMK5_HOLLE|nr:Nucleotide-binding oligomerization domain-containing protein 2 [Holothuria leucospilota]
MFPFTENEKIFIRHLKQKYKEHYDNIQTIPYVKDKLYSISTVFVEGGMEYYTGSNWQKMNSYNEIAVIPPGTSKRSFILGGAGHGKSTLTLQYAYDWCNEVRNSFSSSFEIMILLRLRQLVGIQSVYTAIRRFILPKHSRLKEIDIKDIMENSSSVLLIFDGLDEYPQQDLSQNSDVTKILLSRIFPNFEVVVTSRYLPQHFSERIKRFRLTGFNEQARQRYIRRAITNEESKSQTIMQTLHKNPVTEYFCQVPLFFVMSAHMSHEDKEFSSLKTVTGFFKYMIKCFHMHMRNKLDDANVQHFFLYEKDHRELDLIAFRGLSGEQGRTVWTKEYLCERLGESFYQQYKRIGVLVEEDILEDDPTYHDSVKTQTQVSFCHKLFCEWYAAHYVTYVARSDTVNLQEFLKRVNQAGNQYMYRFACGINFEAAEKLIMYVKSKPDGNKFATLCLMEQEDKIESFLDIVKDLLSKKIELHKDINNFRQRFTLQLLETASRKNVSQNI